MQTEILSPENNYLFKVNNGNTKTRHDIYSKYIAMTPEQHNVEVVPV